MTDSCTQHDANTPATSVAMALLTIAAHVFNGAAAPLSVNRLSWPNKVMCVQLDDGTAVADWAYRLGIHMETSHNRYQRYVSISTGLARLGGCAVQFWATEPDHLYAVVHPKDSGQPTEVS